MLWTGVQVLNSDLKWFSKTVKRCLCLQFIQEIFQNIPCFMNLLNFREKKCSAKFQQIPLNYNCEFSLYVKHYMVSSFCFITKNIVSFIAYQSWYFKLVSCCCRTVTILHEALQVLLFDCIQNLSYKQMYTLYRQVKENYQ